MREDFACLRASVLDALGETQRDQAEAIGLPQATVSQLRNGRKPRSKIEKLLLLTWDELSPRTRETAVRKALGRLQSD
jgi:transcriptional regulator with XRE-family HTH domain